LLEKLGDNRGALTAARRRTDAWTQNNPYRNQLREQGRLAALVGEREERFGRIATMSRCGWTRTRDPAAGRSR
jgi:hypothetical protein